MKMKKSIGLGLAVVIGLLVVGGVAVAATQAASLVAAIFGGGGGRRQSENVLVEDSLTDMLVADYRFNETAPSTTPAPPAPTLIPPVPTVPPTTAGDSYELDDTCADARTIAVDGTQQIHSLHKQGDADWIRFVAAVNETYMIQAAPSLGSPLDLSLELHASCGSFSSGQNFNFTPGVRVQFTATLDGPIYLKLSNIDGGVFGETASYHISVMKKATVPPQGAVIIIAGRLTGNDPLQANIHTVTNRAYQMFAERGYPKERIYYLSNDVSNVLVNRKTSLAGVQAAITTWAADKVSAQQALTLYLMDHGGQDVFYLDNTANEVLTPAQLDGWLAQLEAQHPGLKVNLIIEACQSGSFLAAPNPISRANRVVITSAGATNNAHASSTGAIFSDFFVAALSEGQSLFDAFLRARWATQIAVPWQTPLLDDNGDGQANNSGDGVEAQRRGFTFSGTFDATNWQPYISAPKVTAGAQAGSRIIRATIADDKKVENAYAVVYPPNYVPPPPQSQMVQSPLQTVTLLDLGDGTWGATSFGFDQLGEYRLVIYAQDFEDAIAQPVSVTSGMRVWMPALVR